MIKFRCHKCNKKIGVHEIYAGRRVLCPQCSLPTRIPETDYGEANTQNASENTQYSVQIYHGVGKPNEPASTVL